MKYTINNYVINGTGHTDRAWSHVISYPELFLHWWATPIRTNKIKWCFCAHGHCSPDVEGRKEERERNLLSSPVYPSSSVSVDVDQNQTFHCIWVCELRRERNADTDGEWKIQMKAEVFTDSVTLSRIYLYSRLTWWRENKPHIGS